MPDRVTSTSTIVAVEVVGHPSAPRLLNDTVAMHGGRILPGNGSGLVSAFDAASQAVLAAADMQALAWREWPDRKVRIGVAAGDVTWDGDECFGMPVATAERLRAVAADGQILVSHTVRVLAGDRAGDRYEHVGPLALAGFDDAVDTFSFGWDRPNGEATPIGAPPMPLALSGTAGNPFVGRADSLMTLTRTWADAGGDTGRVVLVGGEAGAGKTRLAAEFARRVHAGGAAVLYGACDDDLALPYQPWVQAFDPVLPALARSRAGLPAGLAPLAPLMTNADQLVPTGGVPTGGDPDAERYRRYAAFSLVLEAVAANWPTLVVLDDLHWAGPQTLALLRHLPRAGLPGGVMIVATFRDTGDEVTEPLASCLADLRRVDGAQRLRVGGLDVASVERFVAGAAGALDDPLRHVARVLAERTGGNAFYVGELWRHLVAAGAVVEYEKRFVVRSTAVASDVPDSVREVVAARLGRLSTPARSVVEVAAIAGQRIDLAVLALAAGEAADVDSDQLATSTDELVAAGLFTAPNGGRPTYQFAHSLVRDTVEVSVSPAARSRLHVAVAHAIEHVHEADARPVLADLARHFAAAAPIGTVDKAVHYGLRAATQASRAGAYDEAVAHLTAVLDLPPPPGRRAELLIELGAAHLRRGFYAASRDAYAEAFELAVDLGSVDGVAQAAIGFESATHFPGLPGGPAVELLRRALDVAASSDAATQARLRASFGRALAISGRGPEGVAIAESAKAKARAVDDPDSLVVSLEALLTALDDPPRQLAEANELADVAARLGDTWSASYASASLFRALVQLGRFDEAVDALERHRDLSASGRYSLFQFMTSAFEALLALVDGRFDDAEKAAERGQELTAADGSPFGDGVYGLQMFAIRRAQGRLAEVAPMMRLLAGRPDAPPMWRPGLAALYTELDMVDEAAVVFASLAANRFGAVPRDAIWPACLAFLAEVGVHVGGAVARPGDLQVLYEELLAKRGQNLMAGFTMCFGPADRLLGALAARLGRHVDADRHFVDATAMATRCRSPVWTAEVQYDWAVALAARGDRDRARLLAAQARATAARLGMRRLAARPDPSARPPIVHVPVTAAPSTPPVDLARPDHLSDREVDVLRWVAAGLSNREIGERLFISQNTVANHVRAILQKTGCANRTEAAGYAIRRGLAET